MNERFAYLPADLKVRIGILHFIMLSKRVQELPPALKLNILGFLTDSKHFLVFKRNLKTQLLESILIDGWLYWFFRSSVQWPQAWPTQTESERNW